MLSTDLITYSTVSMASDYGDKKNIVEASDQDNSLIYNLRKKQYTFNCL
jgi:hypothetical protein